MNTITAVVYTHEGLTNKEALAASSKHDQSSSIHIHEGLTNDECEGPSASQKWSRDLTYKELTHENKKLKQTIQNLQKSMEERLQQQASMFRKLRKKTLC